MSWFRVYLLSLVFCGFCFSLTFADGPADNNPDTVRPVPKVGIEVPAEDRMELEAGLKKLGGMLEELRPKFGFDRWNVELRTVEELLDEDEQISQQKLTASLVEDHTGDEDRLRAWDNYADVAIFHRAVYVALEEHEFFDAKEIDVAKNLLKIGMERAGQLKSGEIPWLEQTGLVVRGYISQIDWTPQPYGLVIPDSYDFKKPKPHRLDLWFHGRGEALSEVNFISQRMASIGPISPSETIVLHPYGRYCNANKFAGEIDSFEALDAVRRRYALFPGQRDWYAGNYTYFPGKIAARGFSMGGAACWQFAVHYPNLWFAANPGAGFSETPEFLKFFQKETLNPPWWEEKLWRWYDCPGYVENLAQLPVVAYSGENDIQKQAADLMETAYEKKGMKLAHLIGPQTGHSIHPESAKEIEARLATAARRPAIDPKANRAEFVTYSLIYPSGGWVVLGGMQEQWEEAKVIAEHKRGEIHITTKNVTEMTLFLDKAFNLEHVKQVVIGGQPFQIRHVLPLILKNEEWQWDRPKSAKGGEYALYPRTWKKHGTPLRKDRETCGPIDHAFMDSFIFVTPSGQSDHPAVQKWCEAEMNRAIVQWRKQMRGDVRIKVDNAVKDEDIQGANLILWGDRKSNLLIDKIADQLPIQWNDAQITVGKQDFDASQHALIAIYPNPKNPYRYIVLNSGFTYREYDYLNNARQTPKLPDWAVVDLRTPPNSRWPGKIAAADFFDEQWQLKPAREEK